MGVPALLKALGVSPKTVGHEPPTRSLLWEDNGGFEIGRSGKSSRVRFQPRRAQHGAQREEGRLKLELKMTAEAAEGMFFRRGCSLFHLILLRLQSISGGYSVA